MASCRLPYNSIHLPAHLRHLAAFPPVLLEFMGYFDCAAALSPSPDNLATRPTSPALQPYHSTCDSTACCLGPQHSSLVSRLPHVSCTVFGQHPAVWPCPSSMSPYRRLSTSREAFSDFPLPSPVNHHGAIHHVVILPGQPPCSVCTGSISSLTV